MGDWLLYRSCGIGHFVRLRNLHGILSMYSLAYLFAPTGGQLAFGKIMNALSEHQSFCSDDRGR